MFQEPRDTWTADTSRYFRGLSLMHSGPAFPSCPDDRGTELTFPVRPRPPASEIARMAHVIHFPPPQSLESIGERLLGDIEVDTAPCVGAACRTPAKPPPLVSNQRNKKSRKETRRAFTVTDYDDDVHPYRPGIPDSFPARVVFYRPTGSTVSVIWRVTALRSEAVNNFRSSASKVPLPSRRTTLFVS